MPKKPTLFIRENVLLRDFTTFRIGGPARFFCEVSNPAELIEAIYFSREKCNGKFFVLGGGSNILVSDQGFDGLVIFMNCKGLSFDTNSAEVRAGAGENWDNFVAQCVSRGFFGIENLSGIPGTVGAAPVQNIGAYGIEVGDFIESVDVYDTKENVWKTFLNKDCDFDYRDSIFKKEKGRYVIVAVTFLLKKTPTVSINYKDLSDYFSGRLLLVQPTPMEVRDAVLLIRSKKLPDTGKIGTAGSFFKNPVITAQQYVELKKRYSDMPAFPADEGFVKIPLAWILDHVCGYKGVTKGRVGTYKNQALVIVNDFFEKDGVVFGATANDVREFANEIIAMVKEKTGIDVEPEVQYV